MLDVLRELEARGWHIQTDEPEELFELDAEIAAWRLMHEASGRQLTLEFHAFGDLGRYTEDLRDIHYCVEPISQETLFFKKRKSEQWRTSVIDFVKRLPSLASRPLDNEG